MIEMTMTTLDISSLTFSPPFCTAKGAQQLPSLFKDGTAVAWQSDDFCDVPFEPSAFGDPEANRVTICVTPSATLCSQIEELDAWCIATLTATPSLLGIAVTADQVKDRYSSSIKVAEKWTTLRLKMNRSGRHAMQCYDTEKALRNHPSTWRGCSVRPRIVFRGLWIMGKDFGSIMELTHAVVQEDQPSDCPF